MKTRAEIFAAAKRLRAGCLQALTDAEHWNAHVRKPLEEVTDPDPDGMLHKTIARVDALLVNEFRLCEPNAP